MENEEYEEIITEENYDEDVTGSDVLFITSAVIVICVVFAFVMKTVKNTFRNMHVKIGDKVEVQIETKGDEK